MDSSTQEMIDLLKAHDILPTKQRVDIARIFLTKPQHASADQLLEMVNRNGAQVSKATVYNTLGLFVSKGLVREINIDSAKVFYDSTTTHHHHLYNVDTGQLTDLNESSVKLASMPPPPAGTVIDGIDIVIRVKSGY